MAAWLPALLQGGASVLSGILPGLFGSSPASQMRKQYQMQLDLMENQREYDRGHFSRLVEDSQRAGINPLTALRGGGGAGYAQTHAPVLSLSAYQGANVGDALAAGLQTGVQAAFDYDPVAEEKSRLELEIMRGQLRRINEDTQAVTRLGGAPVATGSRYRAGGSALGAASKLQAGERTLTSVFPVGSTLQPNPSFVDATAWETRYGDIAQEIGGAINATADTYYNVRNKAPAISNFVERYHPLGWLFDRAPKRSVELKEKLERKASSVKYRTGETW